MKRTIVVSFVGASCVFGGSASASPSFDLPEPDAPPPREITEQGDSPLYYRLPPGTVSFLSRTSLGGHTRLDDIDTAFTLDVMAGAYARFGRDASMGIWVEGGYSYVRGSEHLAVLGIGLAHRKRTLFCAVFALVPHVVAGKVDGELGIGARTSAIAGWGAWGLELAHQVVIVEDQRVHEMHLAVTFPFVAGVDE
jgi:hypothetical protein